MRTLPKLKMDREFGQGDIEIPPEFSELDPLLRADVISDWLLILGREYQIAQRAYRRSLKSNQ